MPGMVMNRDTTPDHRILNHLPSTVTMRRSQSPMRRPKSFQGSQSSTSGDPERSAGIQEAAGERFFLASDAVQTAKTPSTTNNKPSFFTANSFSNSAKTVRATPELRRAESVNEVRTRSNSRPTVHRTPTLRDSSPSRQPAAVRLRPATIPKLVASQDSSSPFANPNLSQATHDPLHDSDFTPSRSTRTQDPRLQRQRSAISLKTGDRASNRNGEILPIANPVLKSPAKDRTCRLVERMSDSSNSQVSVTDPPDQKSFSSPQSVASTAPTTAIAESVPSQPAQTNRKIMDLEIRNTSLLAVNTQLERQARKQTAELKEMRKRLAHAQQFPSSTPHQGVERESTDPEDGDVNKEVTAEDDLQEVGSSLLEAASLVDRSIKRALLLSEQLLHDAQRGLHYRPRESEIGLGVLRVLQSSTPDITKEIQEEDISRMSEQSKRDYVVGNILDEGDISGVNLAGENME